MILWDNQCLSLRGEFPREYTLGILSMSNALSIEKKLLISLKTDTIKKTLKF